MAPIQEEYPQSRPAAASAPPCVSHRFATPPKAAVVDDAAACLAAYPAMAELALKNGERMNKCSSLMKDIVAAAGKVTRPSCDDVCFVCAPEFGPQPGPRSVQEGANDDGHAAAATSILPDPDGDRKKEKQLLAAAVFHKGAAELEAARATKVATRSDDDDLEQIRFSWSVVSRESITVDKDLDE